MKLSSWIERGSIAFIFIVIFGVIYFITSPPHLTAAPPVLPPPGEPGVWTYPLTAAIPEPPANSNAFERHIRVVDKDGKLLNEFVESAWNPPPVVYTASADQVGSIITVWVNYRNRSGIEGEGRAASIVVADDMPPSKPPEFVLGGDMVWKPLNPPPPPVQDPPPAQE